MGVLVLNEWIKLFKKKSTWVMLVLLILGSFGLNWIARISTEGTMNANEQVSRLSSMLPVLNLFVVIVGASIVAEEFSRGTIKFLLIRPYSRSQILAAKFITAFLFSIVGSILVLIASLISANLFLVSQSPFMDLQGVSTLLWIVGNIGTNLLQIMLYLSITLLISAVVRSQALAVGLGMGVIFGSPVINILLLIPIEKYKWLKWNLFQMLKIKGLLPSLLGVSQTDTMINELTYWQMASALLLYSVLIYACMNALFKKRDVALS